jgi:protoporphyrinogen oxidase
MTASSTRHVVIIGAGFCGLTAGYELSKRGIRVTILEADADIGGLAGSFEVNGVRVEKFYHHWFTNDEHIPALVNELGTRDQIVFRPTRTGMYYANKFFKLSTPLDVLRFTPLSVPARFRLGVLALRARRVRDWRQLEALTAAEWLRRMGGEQAYRVVWEPLLRGKFGRYAPEIGAVWFWNKLKLRGGSRGKSGEEQLAYYRGGFAALADQLATRVRASGGRVLTGAPVQALVADEAAVAGVVVGGQRVDADAVVATPALPIVADLIEPHASADYVSSLRRIRYLANVCLVLELDRSLSQTYWLNVNDPSFPFVGLVEHTNFEPPSTYGGRHLAYLSKYLPDDEPMFAMSDAALVEFSLPHLRRMFPAFERAWIRRVHVWRARYAQPVVERNYGRLIPASETPLPNLYLATMAQVYPEDRGTNYAVREGRRIAAAVIRRLAGDRAIWDPVTWPGLPSRPPSACPSPSPAP